jgi:hypothetical protein
MGILRDASIRLCINRQIAKVPHVRKRRFRTQRSLGSILSSTQWCIQLKTSCGMKLAERGIRRGWCWGGMRSVKAKIEKEEISGGCMVVL